MARFAGPSFDILGYQLPLRCFDLQTLYSCAGLTDYSSFLCLDYSPGAIVGESAPS